MIQREAIRFLQASPLLSLAAVGVLALGIGASTFALALLYASSSLTSPGVRQIGHATIAEETEGGGSAPIDWKRFEELRTPPTQDAKLAAYSNPLDTTLRFSAESESLRVAAVSKGFFNVFTYHLTVGRDFSLDDEGEADRRVTILGFSLAVRLFHSPTSAVSQWISLGASPYQVIGVAPRGFNGLFGASVSAWVPASSAMMDAPPQFVKLVGPDFWREMATFYGLAASDRLSSDKLPARLIHSLRLHLSGVATLHVSQGLTVDPVRDAKLRKWLRLGFFLAVLFTIVSGLNYSLLLLGRVPRLANEIRLKRALGAGTGRLVVELTVGPGTTVAIALVAALLLWAGSFALLCRLSGYYSQVLGGSWLAALEAFGVNLLFACAITLLIALIPALALLQDSGAPQLSHTSTAYRQTGVTLQALVTLQISFCIVTWILAGMVVCTLISNLRLGLGYDPSRLVVMETRARPNTILSMDARNDTFPPHATIESLVAGLAALPGVQNASFADAAPFGSPMTTLTIERTDTTLATPRTVNVADVSPGFFRSVGARMIRGTDFSWSDIADGKDKVVINQTLARELWQQEDPVGHSVKMTQFYSSVAVPSNRIATIAGVVGDMRFAGYSESPGPTVFRSLHAGYGSFYLVVNGMESLSRVGEVASHELATEVPQLEIVKTYSVAEYARASRWEAGRSSYLALAGALAMCFLAAVGLYGSLTYYVNSRRRELAIRVCLGALPWTIRKIVLARAARCAVLAAVLSVPLWPLLARLSSSEYLGPVSWSNERAVFLLLVCVASSVLISLLPSSTAAHISPADALRYE